MPRPIQFIQWDFYLWGPLIEEQREADTGLRRRRSRRSSRRGSRRQERRSSRRRSNRCVAGAKVPKEGAETEEQQEKQQHEKEQQEQNFRIRSSTCNMYLGASRAAVAAWGGASDTGAAGEGTAHFAVCVWGSVVSGPIRAQKDQIKIFI